MLSRLLLSLTLLTLLSSSVADSSDGYDFKYEFVMRSQSFLLEVDTKALEGHAFREFNDGILRTLNTHSGRSINTSRDLGMTWKSNGIPLAPTGPGGADLLFTTSEGSWITWKDWQLWRCDANTRIWSKAFTGFAGWLGTSSIAERNGTIMVAEYHGDNTEEMRVLRSVDDGRTWGVVLVLRGALDPQPEVNHLHTLEIDPYTGNWWLTSGDWPGLCRFWITSDNGNNWKEVTDLNVHPQWQRTTDLWFTETDVVWGMDDPFLSGGQGGIGGPRLLSSPKTVPLQINDHGRLSKNAIRCAIGYADVGHLLITENYPKYEEDYETGIELVWVTPALEIVPIGSIPVLGFFTSSRFGPDAVGTLDEGMVSFTYGRQPEFNDYLTWRFTVTRVYQVNTSASFGGDIVLSEQPPFRKGDAIGVIMTPWPGYLLVALYKESTDKTRAELVWEPVLPYSDPATVEVTIDSNMHLEAVFIRREDAGLPATSTLGYVSLIIFFLISGGMKQAKYPRLR